MNRGSNGVPAIRQPVPVVRAVEMNREGELPQASTADAPAPPIANTRQYRKQQRRQKSRNRDHEQQFHQGKSRRIPTPEQA